MVEMWNRQAHGKIHDKMARRLLTSEIKETYEAAVKQVCGRSYIPEVHEKQREAINCLFVCFLRGKMSS